MKSLRNKIHLPLIIRHLATTSNPKWAPPLNPNPQFTTLSNLLLNTPPGPPRIELDESLLLQIFHFFDSEPHTLLTLFNWLENWFQSSTAILNLMIKALFKARKYDYVWALVLDRIANKDTSVQSMPDTHTFGIIIRRYARAGMPLLSIQTYEFASRLEFIPEADIEHKMFVVLLGSLCKNGHMRVAMDYFNNLKNQGKTFVSSTRTYNILLNGWFHCKKLDEAERLWSEMKMENIKPTIVTYCVLVEGLCRMRRVRTAINLINEMKSGGIEPDVIFVYNPIIDALGEAGMMREALGFMERCSVLKCGPTISTYNSLVKGFCKARDIEGAGKILKKMIDKGCMPTSTTYNYFFKYFSETGQVQEGLNLYKKLMESGYTPDRLTYHLLVKMLCEQERLDSAIQVTKVMRERGYDMNLAICTMLIHLMCKLHRFDDALEGLEYMNQRGIVPQDLTFDILACELKNRGLTEKLKQLHDLMGSVPHSTDLPDTYIRKED